MKRVPAAAAAMTLLVLGACSPAENEIDTLAARPSLAATVTITADGIEPAEVEIPAGDIVTIVNASDTDARITGELPAPEAAETDDDPVVIDSGVQRPGDQVELILEEPGTVTLVDQLVPGRQVVVTVVSEPEDG
jgi:plastocyanin